jgi:hypothetical protein
VRPPPTPITFRQCRLILPSLGNKSNGPEKTSPDPGRPKTLERAPAARTAKPANRQMDGNCTFTGENLRPGEGLHCALLPPRRKPMQATCEACPNREPGLDHTGQSHLRVPEKSTSTQPPRPDQGNDPTGPPTAKPRRGANGHCFKPMYLQPRALAVPKGKRAGHVLRQEQPIPTEETQSPLDNRPEKRQGRRGQH